MRLVNNFLKDLTLSFKGMYIYIELIMAFIFIAIIIFVVPDSAKSVMNVYLATELDGINNQALASIIDDNGSEYTVLHNKDEIIENMKEDRQSIGLFISEENGQIAFDYILQGYEDQKYINILETTTKVKFLEEVEDNSFEISVRNLEKLNEIIDGKINILIVYLSINAGFMGLFIIAAYIFLDKKEGVIRAFAVTPSQIWEYLAGKVGVLMIMGLITGLICAATIAKLDVNYFYLILMLIVFNVFGSVVGLFVSSFFDSMQKAMGALYILIMVMAIPAISYYIPSFAPIPIKVIPSYLMLFTFREAFLEKPDIGMIFATLGVYIVATVILFAITNMRFKKTLTV